MIISADGSNFSPILFPLINSSVPSEKLLPIRQAYLLQTWEFNSSRLCAGVNEATAGVFSRCLAITTSLLIFGSVIVLLTALRRWMLVIRLCQRQTYIFPESNLSARLAEKSQSGPACNCFLSPIIACVCASWEKRA
jgi:hypothetical protein